jgi:uncharacterized protein (TIGR02996 family)
MSDEDALLRAIVETPDDLALRMVYADWCDENGRAERAALIRGQCFLDPVLIPPGDPNEYSPHIDPRFLGAWSLSPHLRESVLAPFRRFADAAGLEWGGISGFASVQNRGYEVRRGFIESFTLTGLRLLAAWIAHAGTILARVPVLHVHVRRLWGGPSSEGDPAHLPSDLLAGLLAVEGVERIRSLNLHEFNLGPAAAETLLKRGGRLRLETLTLRHRTLSRATALALTERFGEALTLLHGPSEDDIPF